MGALLWIGGLLRKVPWQVWAALVVVGALYGTHLHYTHKAVAKPVAANDSEWKAKEAAQKKANDEAVATLNAKYRQSETDHEAALYIIGAQHANDLAGLRARQVRDLADARSGAIKLSVAARCGNANNRAAPQAGTAPAVGDGEARTELPAEVTANLLALANDADEAVVQLTACQAVIEADRKEQP